MLFSPTEEEHSSSKRLEEIIRKLFSGLYSGKWTLTFSLNVGLSVFLSFRLSTGFVPVMNKVDGVMACSFGRLTAMAMESLAWRYGGRLPGVTLQSHGTMLSRHGAFLVPRPTFLISIVTSCEKARYYSWKPYSVPCSRLESVLRGSFVRHSKGPTWSHLSFRKPNQTQKQWRHQHLLLSLHLITHLSNWVLSH